MAESSDAVIKREIKEILGETIGELNLRIFIQNSRDDQRLVGDGGLTFSHDGKNYGSCDAGYFIQDAGGEEKVVIAIEGTDALNRKSSGNAQNQRFHHALGAVKNGLTGIYYLRKGKHSIRPDLYETAYIASKKEKGNYLIINDLKVLKDLLSLYDDKKSFDIFVQKYLEEMHEIFVEKFTALYDGDWETFADKRSTIIKPDYVIKHAGRSKRGFTDSSQRSGHIAVGEMYLTKYFFYGKKVYYLFPKMPKEDLIYLDKHKANDKEWHLLRHEPNVEIKTMDDIKGLPKNIREELYSIKDKPLKGEVIKNYNSCMKTIVSGLKDNSFSVV
jgi:hypothetical protein